MKFKHTCPRCTPKFCTNNWNIFESHMKIHNREDAQRTEQYIGLAEKILVELQKEGYIHVDIENAWSMERLVAKTISEHYN